MPDLNVINPAKTALLLCDFENDVVMGFCHDKTVVGRAARAAAEARKLKVPVMFVKVQWKKTYEDFPLNLNDVILAYLGSLKPTDPPPPALLVEGTRGAEIVPELTPQADDYVFIKRRVSPFYGTSLETVLHNKGVDTVLVGGIATNMVVTAAVVDGRDRDFHMVVLKDCCAAPTKEVHEAALAGPLPFLARVMTSEQAFNLARGYKG